MDRLPIWADHSEARALLAAIRIEQPECWMLRRWAWTDTRQPKFKGSNARALRRMWEAAREAAMEAGDHTAFARLSNHEHPDDVIERVLNEHTVPFTPMEFKELPNGWSQVAA